MHYPSIAADNSWRLLAHYLAPRRGRALLLAILLLCGIGLQLLSPQIIAYAIDATTRHAMGSVTAAALLFLAVAALNQVLTSGATYISQDLTWTATNALRTDLAAHCLHLDMSFHNRRTPGELIERIDGDVTALSTFFSQMAMTVLTSALLLLGALALLYRVDWRVGIALSIFAVAALIVLVRSRSFAVDALRAERQANANLYGFLEERLSGLEDLRANGAYAYTMLRLHQVTRDLFRKEIRAELMRTTVWISTAGLFTLGTVAALAMGAYLYHQGAISLGTVYLIFQYTEMLRAPLERITQQLQDLQKATAATIRVRELLGLQSAIRGDGSQALPEGALDVEFDRVDFAYDEEPVLHDVTFRLQAGQVLGLLGRTGSGKSTLIRLLFHLYEPTSGSVRVGGVDTRLAEAADLRRRIAMVTQDVQLFHATVRDNLTLFDHTMPEGAILDAIERVGLEAWYRALPAGLDTELAADAGGISAGEAQLLAFCRAFLKDPGLIILDEPSSRLDPATEARIEHALDTLLHGRTAIIIAHRLGTVAARAGEIMVLEDGHVQEHGRRDQLAANPRSRFAALLRASLHEVSA